MSRLRGLAGEPVALADVFKEGQPLGGCLVPGLHPGPAAPLQPFGECAQIRRDDGPAALQAGAQGVAVGFGPLGGEPDEVGRQPVEQRGQIGFFILNKMLIVSNLKKLLLNKENILSVFQRETRARRRVADPQRRDPGRARRGHCPDHGKIGRAHV